MGVGDRRALDGTRSEESSLAFKRQEVPAQPGRLL